MKIVENLVRKLVFSLINTAASIAIVYWNIMTFTNALKTPDADWNQVWTYMACSIVILLVMWVISFLKFLKNLVIVLLILLFVGWFYLPKVLPGVTDGLCVSMGSCNEGVEVKTVSGKVIINQQNCIKNKWIWIADKKTCKTK